MENLSQKIFNLFQSNTAKLLMIGFLTLILLIPLLFVQDLIRERSVRKKEMINEVSKLWGTDIYFYGPILKVPYVTYETYNITNPKTGATTIEKKQIEKFAYFFPKELKNTTNVKKNEGLKRGIFNHVVFTAQMSFSGSFSDLNLSKINLSEENMLWNKASLMVQTTNLKSIKSELKLKINNKIFSFEPQPENETQYSELATENFDYNSISNDGILNFNFDISYNGSNSIKFIPIAKNSFYSVASDWNSPSFEGNFAANDTTKSISKKGFYADWKILDINRTFSQQYAEKLPDLDTYLFGVKFIKTVDEYQQNERASKYGFLVIGLTFLVFFLIQITSKTNLHIFQYTMIGLALILFYTLLISITEHSTFTFAYTVASISVIGLIGLYSYSILKNKKFALFIVLALCSLYTFIFVIIQLEDYALLVGSIGLFAILAAVMYFS